MDLPEGIAFHAPKSRWAEYAIVQRNLQPDHRRLAQQIRTYGLDPYGVECMMVLLAEHAPGGELPIPRTIYRTKPGNARYSWKRDFTAPGFRRSWMALPNTLQVKATTLIHEWCHHHQYHRWADKRLNHGKDFAHLLAGYLELGAWAMEATFEVEIFTPANQTPDPGPVPYWKEDR
jgi:hypothetical protein